MDMFLLVGKAEMLWRIFDEEINHLAQVNA